jgi:hypothetical protein
VRPTIGLGPDEPVRFCLIGVKWGNSVLGTSAVRQAPRAVTLTASGRRRTWHRKCLAGLDPVGITPVRYVDRTGAMMSKSLLALTLTLVSLLAFSCRDKGDKGEEAPSQAQPAAAESPAEADEAPSEEGAGTSDDEAEDQADEAEDEES